MLYFFTLTCLRALRCCVVHASWTLFSLFDDLVKHAFGFLPHFAKYFFIFGHFVKMRFAISPIPRVWPGSTFWGKARDIF